MRVIEPRPSARPRASHRLLGVIAATVCLVALTWVLWFDSTHSRNPSRTGEPGQSSTTTLNTAAHFRSELSDGGTKDGAAEQVTLVAAAVLHHATDLQREVEDSIEYRAFLACDRARDDCDLRWTDALYAGMAQVADAIASDRYGIQAIIEASGEALVVQELNGLYLSSAGEFERIAALSILNGTNGLAPRVLPPIAFAGLEEFSDPEAQLLLQLHTSTPPP